MEVTFITHAGRNGYGGIAKYSDHFIFGLDRIKDISKINVFSRIKMGNRGKVKNYSFQNKFIFFLIINLKFILFSKTKIIFVSHINLLPCALLALFFGKKVVLINYGLEIWGENKNLLNKFLLKKIKYFICMREYTKNILIKKYSLKNKFFYSLPNFIRYKKNKLENNKKKNIVSVARLDSEEKFKGIDETLEAMQLLNKIDFIYYIIGDGSDKERLIKKTKKLGLEKHVIFLGKISDKKRDHIFNSSHILSMPGSDKTFDTYPARFVFLEAALFGLKIIASKPPKNEINDYDKYKSIFFVDPKKKIEISKKIEKLQGHKKFIDKMFLSDFSISKFNSRIKNILGNIIIK